MVRFFSAETRHLEPLISAIEAADSIVDSDTDKTQGWSWEERYITLLWLSHLLLVPFDLATISSNRDASQMDVEGLIWPLNIPGVAVRAISLAMKYLEAAGKERDAAKVLLVRISMRKDMQELGLLDALVRWALSSLHSSTVVQSNYFHIGVLSFLAGMLVSASSTSDMDPYLDRIYNTVHELGQSEVAAFKSVHSSALAKKIVIKVMRTIAVLELRSSAKSSNHQIEDTTEIVETSIGHMLEALADNDTPVRLAASKALSVITQKLVPTMAAQVVEAVIDSLSHNVLWETKIVGQKTTKVRDLSAVNPQEWHGLILTLSQLLYRRSPPPDTLSGILHSLLIGLSFERRSTSGSSIGTNVRDAACFGIWALARRYTSAELQAIDKASVITAQHHDESTSIIQILATELVVAACLDPAGNIRRGASAALQELIGRHPDTVENGIAVVQTVDYHRVALRSKAMNSVGPDAAALSRFNDNALVDALFGWRGVGDGDAVSRRNAAACLGAMATLYGKWDGQSLTRCMDLIGRTEHSLGGLKLREVDQRHGLLLSLAVLVSSICGMMRGAEPNTFSATAHPEQTGRRLRELTLTILRDAKASTYRRPDLIAEAVCSFIGSSCSLLENDAAGEDRSCEIIQLMDELLIVYLSRSEKDVIVASIEAASAFISFSDIPVRAIHAKKWIEKISGDSSGRITSPGFILTLGAVFHLLPDSSQRDVLDAILDRWRSVPGISSKISLLSSLCQGSILTSHSNSFTGIIGEALDDYTTDARGDIGSQVRIKALQAVTTCFTFEVPAESYSNETVLQERLPLYGKVLRLTAEKLDKVRTEAQLALVSILSALGYSNEAQSLKVLQVSSEEYFTFLLELQHAPATSLSSSTSISCLRTPAALQSLLSGYVTSADTGSESLIRVSRAALASFCSKSEHRLHIVSEALLQVMKSHLENDRTLVPTMEVVTFLFDTLILQNSTINFRSLFITTQKAHFKSGNVRKLEAAVKLYSGLLNTFEESSKDAKDVEKKLVSMLLHPFPAVRSAVVDVLWMRRGLGEGVDWTKAKKDWKEYESLKTALAID